jgi:hypothetical protein
VVARQATGVNLELVDAQIAKRSAPRCPQPFRRTHHVVVPQRIASRQPDVDPDLGVRLDQNGASSARATRDLEEWVSRIGSDVGSKVGSKVGLRRTEDHRRRADHVADRENPLGSELVVRPWSVELCGRAGSVFD